VPHNWPISHEIARRSLYLGVPSLAVPSRILANLQAPKGSEGNRCDGTVLCGYYLFVLYEPRDTLHVEGIALVLTDGDFLNNDLALAEGHRNVSEGHFGSYGDAFIRTRKMYRFPNPLTEPDFRYRVVFVTPEAGLEKTGALRFLAKDETGVQTGLERVFYAYEAA
jgi:hypothetical protein